MDNFKEFLGLYLSGLCDLTQEFHHRRIVRLVQEVLQSCELGMGNVDIGIE